MTKINLGQCSVIVFEGRGFNHRCLRNAVVERDSKLYCNLHDPEYIKAKARKWEDNYNKERAEREKRYEQQEIVQTAYDVCYLINPDNPIAVANNIKKMKAVCDLLELYDKKRNPELNLQEALRYMRDVEKEINVY